MTPSDGVEREDQVEARARRDEEKAAAIKERQERLGHVEPEKPKSRAKKPKEEAKESEPEA